MNQTDKDRNLLEGAIGYIIYLIHTIEQGKVKTLEELKTKLSDDGEQACGALSLHLEDRLKIAGFATAFTDDANNPEEDNDKEVASKEEKEVEAPMCPSGCGTKLVKRKFCDVFEETGEMNLKEIHEELYCETCHMRWLPEKHHPIADYLLSETQKTHAETETTKPIEYEEVIIRVPKQVMDLLRFATPMMKDTPQTWIEWQTVESVRSNIDAEAFVPNPKALTDKFNLNPVFQEILNDAVE